jgi:hypothetical protein
MSVISSIIRRHNHISALAYMGLATENIGFPAVVPCPCCGETTLYLYDDTAREDVWLNCDNCSVHGNIITFGAHIWKLDITATADRFAAEGLCAKSEDAVELAHIAARHNKLQKAEEFWDTVAGQLWNHGDELIEYRLRDLGISREIACSGMLGVATEGQVGPMCTALGRAFPRGVNNKKPLLVFPYYDLPGRLSGFLLTQYGEEFEVRRSFVPLNRAPGGRPEAGYYMLKTALLPINQTLKNSYFVVDDPGWAIKAQTTQLRYGMSLLPICASYTGQEAASRGTSWHSFNYSRRFFYGRTITPEIISQAATCKGYVCPAPPENAVQPAMPVRTMKRLATICRSAVTWQTALSDVFNTLSPPAIQAFAGKLNISRDKMRQFLKDKTTVSTELELSILDRLVAHHGVAPERKKALEIIERADGWYTPAGVQIINCLIVIQRIIYTEVGDKYYAGYVKKQDKIFEFFESSKRVDRMGLLAFVEQLLAGRNELVIYSPYWNRKSISFALSLHTPEILNISNEPGWNDKTREFQFSNYAIANDGAVKPSICPQLPSKTAFSFPEPQIAAPLAIRPLLTPTHENAFIWTLTAAILADLVAPIVNAAPTSICIPAGAFNAAVLCGKAINCQYTEIEASHAANAAARAAPIRKLTRPGFVEAPHEDDKWLMTAIARYPDKPCFLRLGSASLPAALTYDWAAISPTAVPDPATDYSALSYIVPAYIQRFLRQRMSTAPANETLIVAVLRDLHRWLDETYGATFNMAAATQILLLPQDAHEAFMVELNKALIDDHIAVLPRPRNPQQPANYILRNKSHWWLNRRAIDKHFNTIGIAPNWTALLNCFAQQGVFCGEDTVHNMPGFLITKSWCDTFWSDYSPKTSKGVG